MEMTSLSRISFEPEKSGESKRSKLGLFQNEAKEEQKKVGIIKTRRK